MPEKTPEHIPTSEIVQENKNLLYAISHTWKHIIASTEGLDWGTNTSERKRIQETAAPVLWRLREHPHYFAYPNSGEQKLSGLLGALPTDPKIIGVLEHGRREGNIDDLYAYSRLSQSEDYGGEKGTVVKIPEMDDLVQQGILTDVVSAAGRRILHAMQAPHYRSLNETLAQRAGVSTGELEQYGVARLNYGLYTIGYLLPHIKTGSESAKFIEQKIITEKIDDLADYLKQNFGLDIAI